MPITELTESEALELLASAPVGRIVIAVDDITDVFPVSHTVIDGAVYFRTSPGEKLAGLTANASVLFEADSLSDTDAWSVVVRGLARTLESDDELEPVLDRLRAPFVRGRKDAVVRIVPASVTGRRFHPVADDDVEPTDATD
jgi:uncharacterized protein